MSGGLDIFWLTGGLGISAVEQITFLHKLQSNRLPASESAIAVVKDILVRKRGEGYVLRAKTGTGKLDDGTALGWYVGWVERDSGPYFFAMNISGKDYDETPRRERIEKTETILTDLGVLPAKRD